MALIKRNLNTILGAFTKPLAELDAFIEEQQKRRDIAADNIVKLDGMKQTQADIVSDTYEQQTKARNVRSKLTDLIGP